MLYSVFFLLVPVANAAFSVHFAGNHDVQVADNHFRNTLKAEHVADLYARVSGKAPLLHEDKMDLPSANLLAAQHGDPAILELFGGNIEDVTSATEIARTDAVRGPALSGIHDILHQHNIKVPSKTVDLSAPDSARVAKEWLSAQTEPVFILHHDYVAAPRVTRRTTSDYTNSTGLTEIGRASCRERV